MFGRPLPENCDSATAIIASKLDFDVQKKPIFVEDGGYIGVDGYVTYRADIKKRLGIVGNVYHIVQNTEAFKFMDGLFEEGRIHYSNAGYLGNGEFVYLIASIPEVDFVLNNDEHKGYICLINSHDGKTGMKGYPILTRNGFFVSPSQVSFSIRHSSKTSSRMVEAQRILKESVNIFDHYHEAISKLSELPFSLEDMSEIAKECAGITLKIPTDERDYTIEEAREYSMGRLNARKTKFIETVHSIISAYRSEASSYGYNGYTAFFSVIKWSNTSPRYKGSPKQREDNKFNKLIVGDLRKLQSLLYAKLAGRVDV